MSFAARQCRTDLAALASLRDCSLRLARALFFVCTTLLVSHVAAADQIALHSAQLVLADDTDGSVALDAQFDFELPPVLEDAVNRGIALYFVVEFELFRPRWYWFDKKLIDITRTYRLTYSPLTRQYRLATGALAQPFD